MRIISFDGRLGSDAEVRTTKGGKPYIRLSVANNIFANGEDRTDWFDVTCYDEFIVDKKAKYLTKGTYVIVTGNVTTEVKPSNGKLWVNHYVTATTIDLPRFGRNQNNEDSAQRDSEPEVSVYTGRTAETMVEPVIPVMPAAAPAVSSPSSTYEEPNFSNDDDLPF